MTIKHLCYTISLLATIWLLISAMAPPTARETHNFEIYSENIWDLTVLEIIGKATVEFDNYKITHYIIDLQEYKFVDFMFNGERTSYYHLKTSL